jgi:hypothetical protein
VELAYSAVRLLRLRDVKEMSWFAFFKEDRQKKNQREKQ